MPSFASSETIDDIFKKLKVGNQRFISGNMREYDFQAQMDANKESQNPESVILSCMDSRGIPETTFDQGIGHLFILRVAGNVVNKDILGSLEYATKIIGSRLIVVMGHTNCGAVRGACQKVDIGHIGPMVSKINFALKKARELYPKSDCSDPKFIDEVARLNVLHVIEEIKQKSAIIAELIKAGQIKIVGAMYDIETGKVSFDID